MTIYCQQGENAIVTFPDGSVKTFNAPIDLNIQTIYGNEGTGILVTDTGRVIYDMYLPIITVAYQNSDGSYTPINGTRGFDFYAYGRGRYGLVDYGQNYGWVYLYYVPWGDYPSSFTVFANGNPLPPSYKFTVKNLGGIELYTKVFSTNTFNVECVKACPENTLDCGDCCLDCEDIYIKLCKILKLFVG